MQCEAIVNLPDWPAGTVKEVDETTEQIKGYLRAPYIRPVVRPREPKPKPSAE